MSNDGPPCGGIRYNPWYKARSVAEVNALWLTQKLIRRVQELTELLRAQGMSEKEIFDYPEIKRIVAKLATLPRYRRT
jgi:hypothetical protein